MSECRAGTSVVACATILLHDELGVFEKLSIMYDNKDQGAVEPT
jgi:hypothetical protein